MSQGLSIEAEEIFAQSKEALDITLLGSEWNSSAGELSTLNRELAIHLSQQPNVRVSLLVPEGACRDEDKKAAQSFGINLLEAGRQPGFIEPLDWLCFPPQDHKIDVVFGHGVKLGRQVTFIKRSPQFQNCKMVHMVHTAPEDLSKYKGYDNPISRGEQKHWDEFGLCQNADLVVPVGPRLKKAYSSYLQGYKKDEDIFEIVPGPFNREFGALVHKAKVERDDDFIVLLCGRGDDEDFELKGYDIAVKAFADQRLKGKPYYLLFVGAPDGKEDEVRRRLLNCGITDEQLTVRKFIQSRMEIKDLFYEVDLVIMPSKSEGFGLVGLEALSAGLPILVGSNSGFAEALEAIYFGETCIIYLNYPARWAKEIASVRAKHQKRLVEMTYIRESYEQKFSWKKQCGSLVDKLWNMVHGLKHHGLKRHGLKRHGLKPIKTRIYEGIVTSVGIHLDLKLGAVHLTFPPDAVSEPTTIMVHRWKCNALSPPLGEHEAVVSNVIEIYTNTDAEAFEFNNEVKLALSHSAPDLKGYELVIKRLADASTNEWEDVDGSEDFRCLSDIVDDYPPPIDIPDFAFPVVQADITECSTYAVVCRLRLSPAYTITVNGGTFSHPDYPDVTIAVPKKSVPSKTKLPLQLKVQEVLQDEFDGLDLCSGPILRILGPPSAEFLRPVTIQLPISHARDPEYIADSSVCRVRIFFLRSDEESKKWIEITSDLENPPCFDGNFVKFQVRHFSGYTCFVHWEEEIRSSASRIISYLSSLIWNQPREANFCAYFQPTERLNSQDILFLICCPVHLREIVKQEHDKEGIKSCHVSSRRKMIPGQDKAFVFVSGGMCPVSSNGKDDFYLRFDGDARFDAQLEVCVISDQEYCKVEFCSTGETTGKNLLCNLLLKPPTLTVDHQERKKRCFDKIISLPEEGGEDLLEGTATPSRERLEWLSINLTSWEPLARRLGFSEGEIKGFHNDNEELAKKALSMLLRWKQKKGSDASYSVLCAALSHEFVGRKDLAEEVIKSNLWEHQ
ncbi:uncharacterized protein [Montipora capricornis]|uniref:uncharacterized protein isoform X2 n=1 Tax=Montipora capricornis TaxID=246305 RepID=UPI0035F1C5B8